MIIHRGTLVYDKADPRHIGIVRNIAWRVYGREGLVDVCWIESGWRSVCAFRDLRPAPDEPAPTFGFPAKARR